MNRSQHTHFGSGTFLVQAFTSVLLAGTGWRLFWSHVGIWGIKNNNRHAVGLARAAGYQY